MELDQLSEVERLLAESVLRQPAPGKHAARSAISHIQKAYLIKDIDPSMALFRAITGQEEAARAIFHALQRRRYLHASKLKWRDHKHKAAVIPFLMAVVESIEQIEFVKAELEFVDVNGEYRLRSKIEWQLPNGRVKTIIPDPPLDVRMEVQGEEYDFFLDIETVVAKNNYANVKKYIHDLANERNRLLYATERGVPFISSSIDADLAKKRENVFVMIAVYLLIDCYPTQQLLVSQSLRAFLKMIGELSSTDES
jgi:hypothetical protein